MFRPREIAKEEDDIIENEDNVKLDLAMRKSIAVPQMFKKVSLLENPV